MPHAVSMASPGLQALILCGPGSSFPTFTANPDENPKALLPIANRPMVWYPLEFCYRMGITNITLICPPSAEHAVAHAMNLNPFLTGLPLPRPEILAPEGLEQTTGTAEILRLPEIKTIVTSDFVVLPCDLVCELGGDNLLQAWSVQSADLADDMLGHPQSLQKQAKGGLGVWYETKTATPIKGEETDFIATVPAPLSSSSSSSSSFVRAPPGSLFPHVEQLVYSMPTDSYNDRVEAEGGFPVRHGLLRKHPRVHFFTTRRDAHIYFFPHWVMRFVAENEELETIGEDVVGWWAKAGWQAGLAARLGFDRILHNPKKRDDRDGSESPSHDVSPTELPLRLKPSSSSSPGALATGPLQSGSTGAQSAQTPAATATAIAKAASVVPDAPPMLAYVHPSSGPLIRRVDTAQLLLQTSLQLARLPSLEEVAGGIEAASPFAHARKVAYPEGVRPRTTITRQDSLVGENVAVQEKTSIKESVVGANCQIREGAKLFQCLLMDGVVVGRNCKLTKCVLGRRCEIGDGCVLTDCEVQENLLVEAKTEAKDEKLMSSSGLEATEEEMQEALQGAEDDGTNRSARDGTTE